MSRARSILLLVAVLATAGGAAWHYSRTEAPAGKKGQASPPVPVKLAKAVMRDMPLKLAITGRTEAYETVTLKSRVEGQVQAVVFTEGQHVRQGDVLLRLDPADFQAKLNQAEANLARSRAQTAKVRADVERYVALREKGFVSEEKVGEMRTAAAATESTANADAAAAELARLQHSYTYVKAPCAGVVGANLVFPGTPVWRPVEHEMGRHPRCWRPGPTYPAPVVPAAHDVCVPPCCGPACAVPVAPAASSSSWLW